MQINYEEWFVEQLNILKNQSQLRSLQDIDSRENSFAILKDEKLLNLSSNDYLGLAGNKNLQEEFLQKGLNAYSNQPGLFTSSSSRLLTGNHALYNKLESQLAAWYKKESALVLGSGYHANVGLIPALANHGDIVFSDKLNHASIIDGLQLTGTKFIRYPHLDYDKLESLLKIHRFTHKKAIIITESLFSMDGDRADLKRLAALKETYNCLLYVDEAHAAGVFGESGSGLCEATGVLPQVDILVGTFGKALASVGAYAVCSKTIRKFLINTTRSLIFSTALPPLNLLWSSFILEKIPDLQKERAHLDFISRQLRIALEKEGLRTAGESQIIPIIIGENEKTLQLANKLRETYGLLIFPIRPPTVPSGTSRLRLSLSANMNWEQLAAFPHWIKKELTP